MIISLSLGNVTRIDYEKGGKRKMTERSRRWIVVKSGRNSNLFMALSSHSHAMKLLSLSFNEWERNGGNISYRFPSYTRRGKEKKRLRENEERSKCLLRIEPQSLERISGDTLLRISFLLSWFFQSLLFHFSFFSWSLPNNDRKEKETEKEQTPCKDIEMWCIINHPSFFLLLPPFSSFSCFKENTDLVFTLFLSQKWNGEKPF